MHLAMIRLAIVRSNVVHPMMIHLAMVWLGSSCGDIVCECLFDHFLFGAAPDDSSLDGLGPHLARFYLSYLYLFKFQSGVLVK